MSAERESLIRRRLEAVFDPLELTIEDQSHRHVGHAGAKDGKSHFDVTIVAPAFEGAGRVERHRMVYDALRDLLETDIHALRIRACTPAER